MFKNIFQVLTQKWLDIEKKKMLTDFKKEMKLKIKKYFCLRTFILNDREVDKRSKDIVMK